MHMQACNKAYTLNSSSDNASLHSYVVGKNDLSERWPHLGRRMYQPFRHLGECTDRTTRRGIFVRGLTLLREYNKVVYAVGLARVRGQTHVPPSSPVTVMVRNSQKSQNK